MGSICSLGKICQSLFYYLSFGSTKGKGVGRTPPFPLVSSSYKKEQAVRTHYSICYFFFQVFGKELYIFLVTFSERTCSFCNRTAPCHLFILHRLNPENDSSTLGMFFSTDKTFSAEGSFTFHRCSIVLLLY